MDIRTEKMEVALFKALEAADAEMERRHGGRFPRHPARPPDGAAASRQYDGLFEFGAGFSAGFGSKFGPGYALRFRIVTLDSVPPAFRAAFESEAAGVLQAELAKAFPDRPLAVVKDTGGWKVVGDLSVR